MPQDKLSPETLRIIGKMAHEYLVEWGNRPPRLNIFAEGPDVHFRAGAMAGYTACAEELDNLRRIAREANDLLLPILEYGQGNPLYKLGCSITEEVLKRAKLWDKHAQPLIDALEEIASGLESEPHNIAKKALNDYKQSLEQLKKTVR